MGCTERKQEKIVENAETKLSENKHLEAAELFRKVISLNPESKMGIKAMYKLGFTLETYLKDYEGAIFNYQEAIRLSRDPVGVYELQKRVANLYFEQSKDVDKAITAYRKLISFNPQSLEVDLFQFRIAQSFFKQNNFEQARLEFQQLVSSFPRSQFLARSRFEIGNSYYMEGKYEIAVEALKQVLRNHPQSEFAVEAEFLIAQCYEQGNKLVNAIQVYENLKDRYSNPKIILFRISELKKRMKKEGK